MSERELWTGDSSEEPPGHVSKVRQAATGDTIVRTEFDTWYAEEEQWDYHCFMCLPRGEYFEVDDA